MSAITISFLAAAIFAEGVKPVSIKRLDGTTIEEKNLTAEIERLAKAAKVHGLAVSVFNNNRAVYSKAFGVKRIDTKESLQTDTVFYGASFSKAVFAVLVMKLVEEKLIDLDTPLQKYLDKPIYLYEAKEWHEDFSSLKNDPRYQTITARMCLNHTTGFPNWRWYEEDETLKIKFSPGSRYSYSGEGFSYLQVVIEKLTKQPLEELMKRKVFEPLGMSMSSYTWQPRFEKNYCYGHSETGEILKKDKDNAARAASTLETTLEDYSRFITGLLSGSVLTAGSVQEIFKPQIRIHSKRQFGALSEQTSAENDAIQLSYGLGWGILQTPYGFGAFKEGHTEGFEHYSILFPEKQTGIVILSNSSNGESIFKELLEIAIMDKYTPWQWEEYIPYNSNTKSPSKTQQTPGSTDKQNGGYGNVGRIHY